MAEGFSFQTLQQCSTLFQPWRGQTGCGAEGQGGGTRTSGGRGPTKPAFENPKLGFVFSKPGFVAPRPGFEAGGAETGRWIAGREGAEAAKICGFIGDFRPFGQGFPQSAFPAERMNSSERFENQTLQPVLH